MHAIVEAHHGRKVSEIAIRPAEISAYCSYCISFKTLLFAMLWWVAHPSVKIERAYSQFNGSNGRNSQQAKTSTVGNESRNQGSPCLHECLRHYE